MMILNKIIHFFKKLTAVFLIAAIFNALAFLFSWVFEVGNISFGLGENKSFPVFDLYIKSVFELLFAISANFLFASLIVLFCLKLIRYLSYKAC